MGGTKKSRLETKTPQPLTAVLTDFPAHSEFSLRRLRPRRADVRFLRCCDNITSLKRREEFFTALSF